MCDNSTKQSALSPMMLWLSAVAMYCGSAQASTWYMKPWKEVYQLVHPGVSPPWKSLNDAQTWAHTEKEVIEPILLRILDSDYEDIPWTHALPIAREIRTGPICDALYARLAQMLRELPDKCVVVGGTGTIGITPIIEILGLSGDSRIQPVALDLISRECQPSLVVERCVEALRRVGRVDAIDGLRDVPLRQRSEHIDRACALTEKAIRLREQRSDILINAQAALRTVTRAWIDAVKAKDMEAYLRVLPFGARGGVDEHDFHVELLQSPELPAILGAAERAAEAKDDEFQIDRDRLEAAIVVEGRYEFSYTLEVDGWKIFGPLRVAP